MPMSKTHQVSVRRPSVVQKKSFFGSQAIPVGRIANTSSQSASVRRQPPPIEAATIAASAREASKAALTSGERIAKAGLKSGLRFMQFLRAYVGAFASGAGSFLLITELASSHFNIFAIIATHLFAIVAAPFYAVMMSPTVFAIYRGLSALGLSSSQRAYSVGMCLGVILLATRLAAGTALVDGNIKADVFALAMLVAGAIAAYTFNRSVARIEAADAQS
jgi:hypothetical protein